MFTTPFMVFSAIFIAVAVLELGLIVAVLRIDSGPRGKLLAGIFVATGVLMEVMVVQTYLNGTPMAG